MVATGCCQSVGVDPRVSSNDVFVPWVASRCLKYPVSCLVAVDILGVLRGHFFISQGCFAPFVAQVLIWDPYDPSYVLYEIGKFVSCFFNF